MAKAKKSVSKEKKTLRALQKEVNVENESLGGAFWKGFLLPVRLIWRGLAWLSHRPPLKQIGHGLRWFFRLKAIRFIGRILGLKYIRDSFAQLRTVTWPSFRDSLRLTGAVISFAVIFGLFVAVVDYGLDKVFKELLLK